VSKVYWSYLPSFTLSFYTAAPTYTHSEKNLFYLPVLHLCKYISIVQGGFAVVFHIHIYRTLIRLTVYITYSFSIKLLPYYSTAFSALFTVYHSLCFSCLCLVPQDRPILFYAVVLCLFICFDGLQFLTQGSSTQVGRTHLQGLYHLSHNSTSFYSGYFGVFFNYYYYFLFNFYHIIIVLGIHHDIYKSPYNIP
jgi:hypothetical protein